MYRRNPQSVHKRYALSFPWHRSKDFHTSQIITLVVIRPPNRCHMRKTQMDSNRCYEQMIFSLRLRRASRARYAKPFTQGSIVESNPFFSYRSLPLSLSHTSLAIRTQPSRPQRKYMIPPASGCQLRVSNRIKLNFHASSFQFGF